MVWEPQRNQPELLCQTKINSLAPHFQNEMPVNHSHMLTSLLNDFDQLSAALSFIIL